MASRAVRQPRLSDQRARPLQYFVRSADHEQGAGHERHGVRPWCGRVLLELRAVPGARQHGAGTVGRTALDHADHVVLGPVLNLHGPCHRRHNLCHRPFSARNGRGGLLPRRRVLHDLLVPVPPSWQGHGRVLCFRRVGRHHRRADRRQSAGTGWHVRPCRLAVDLPRRGLAGGPVRCWLPPAAARPAFRGCAG